MEKPTHAPHTMDSGRSGSQVSWGTNIRWFRYFFDDGGCCGEGEGRRRERFWGCGVVVVSFVAVVVVVVVVMVVVVVVVITVPVIVPVTVAVAVAVVEVVVAVVTVTVAAIVIATARTAISPFFPSSLFLWLSSVSLFPSGSLCFPSCVSQCSVCFCLFPRPSRVRCPRPAVRLFPCVSVRGGPAPVSVSVAAVVSLRGRNGRWMVFWQCSFFVFHRVVGMVARMVVGKKRVFNIFLCSCY